MHCEECGLLLDGVDDDEVLKHDKYYTIVFCPKHARENLDFPAIE